MAPRKPTQDETTVAVKFVHHWTDRSTTPPTPHAPGAVVSLPVVTARALVRARIAEFNSDTAEKTAENAVD